MRFQLPNNLDLTFEFNSQTLLPAYRDAAAATRSRSAPVSGTTTRRTASSTSSGACWARLLDRLAAVPDVRPVLMIDAFHLQDHISDVDPGDLDMVDGAYPA